MAEETLEQTSENVIDEQSVEKKPQTDPPRRQRRERHGKSEDITIKLPLGSAKILKTTTTFLDKHWHLVALGAIFALFLWLHGIPLKNMVKYLPDIDVYYLYRIAETTFNSGFALPFFDALRYFPLGFDPHLELIGDYYLPAVLYGIAKTFTGVSFFEFAKILPILLSGLAILPLYGIGKEIHNKYTGLLAAFFFAVIAGSYFRTSAGEFEKEALSVLFWFAGFYFFITAAKTKSWLKGILAGLSIATMGLIWGGVQISMLVFAAVVLVSLLVNKHVHELLPAYAPIVLIGGGILSYNHYGFMNLPFLLNYLIFGVLILRLAVERFGLVSKEKLKYVVPGILVLGLIALIVGSFLFASIARIVLEIQILALYRQTGVLGQTVAEDIPPAWGQFVDSLGATNAAAIFPQLMPILPIFGLWIAAFLGAFLLLYRIYGRKSWEFGLAAVLWLTNILSVVLYYNRPETSIQAVFVVSMLLLIILAARKSLPAAFALALLYLPITGALVRIRFFYLAGPFVALLAAYFASSFFSWVIKVVGFREEWKTRGLGIFLGEAALIGIATISISWYGVYSVFAWIFFIAAIFLVGWTLRKKLRLAAPKLAAFSIIAALVGLYFVVNFAAAFAVANSLGTSFNDNWASAMNHMKNETPQESVILSWWDFGYWFQLMGQRATVMDGGNAYSERNTEAAKYFTGEYDLEKQKAYLQRYGVTHVLVDISMILKYSAMSKIATQNAQIDAFGQFNLAQRTQRDNRTILIYDGGGGNSILVPINPATGGLSGNVVLSTPQGQAYIKEVCTTQGRAPLNPPNDKPTIDGCIALLGQFLFFANPRVADSTFTKLYFQDGFGLDYLEKVFDNTEVKIYKVNLPLKGREELLKEWKELGCKFWCFTPGAGLPKETPAAPPTNVTNRTA